MTKSQQGAASLENSSPRLAEFSCEKWEASKEILAVKSVHLVKGWEEKPFSLWWQLVNRKGHLGYFQQKIAGQASPEFNFDSAEFDKFQTAFGLDYFLGDFALADQKVFLLSYLKDSEGRTKVEMRSAETMESQASIDLGKLTYRYLKAFYSPLSFAKSSNRDRTGLIVGL